MEKILEQRTNFIDFIKGIAIFLMLYGHSLQYGSGADFLQSGQYWENNVMKVIYSFHMPLFITISGYLFWFSIQKAWNVEQCKKANYNIASNMRYLGDTTLGRRCNL